MKSFTKAVASTNDWDYNKRLLPERDRIVNDLLSKNVMESELRLQLLGPPQIVLDGQTVEGFKSVKTRALLFYVAIAQRPRSRAELAAMFWPEVSEKRANTSLRAALSNLRRLIGAHLEISRRTVALNPNSNTFIDVTHFDALLKPGIGEVVDILQVETAVSLYAGDFLEGFYVPDAPDFEQFAATEGTRLRGALLGALHTLALWHAERSEYQASLNYLARLLALDPIREVGHRLKMAVLALTGQRGAALTHFDVSRQIRSEQLGLDPTPETVALYELILHDRFPGEDQQPISELIADTQSRGIDSGVDTALERLKTSHHAPPSKIANIDWGDMPTQRNLHGRQHQLFQLEQWLAVERCRLVAILGIGGVGKTALAAEVTRLMAGSSHEHPPDIVAVGGSEGTGEPPFDQIIWRSLVNTPPMMVILNDWLQVLPAQKLSELPETLEAKLGLLLKELKRQRCLLILDNAESVLQDDVRDGQGKPVHEAYLKIVRLVAKSDHQSCLLLTSREAPRGVRQRAEANPDIQLLQLGGLPTNAGAGLLRHRGLEGSDKDLESIVERYSGNPLALGLVADTVQELFAGDVNEFLGDETLIFADIRGVLDQQFERLSLLEQEIMIWLAVEREPVPAQVLWDDLAYSPHRRLFLEALRILQRRSLLERSTQSGEGRESRFALQNVVMEYVTSRLVETVCRELESGELFLLQRHALVKAHTKEYVENSQRRLLLQPVASWLSDRLGKAGAIDRLRDMLEAIHKQAPRTPGYAGANILHLLLDIGADLGGYDFSHMAIWQADLRDTSLHDVSFRGCDLKETLFRDIFGLVLTLAISPDGQLLAVGSSDGSIMLWGLAEYQPRHILKQHTEFVSCLAFSQDGRFLASGSRDLTIRVWDVDSGRSIRHMSGHTASIFALALSPDGKTLFSGSEDQTIGVWDVQSGQIRQQLHEHGDVFPTVAVSPDGQNLASGGHDGLVYLWDAHTGKLRYKIHGHEGKVQTVAFAPDGATMATAGEDNQIHLWYVQDGVKYGTLPGHDNWVLSVAFSPDGALLASGSADETIRLWDIQSSRTVRVLRGYNNWVTSVVFSPDGDLVAGGSYDRRIRLWDASSGRLLHTLRGSLRWVDQVIFSPDGQLLASASFDKPVLLWDVQAGQLLQTLHGHSGSVRRLAFSPDGRTLAGGSDDHTIRLWETGSGDLGRTLTGHESFVRTLAFSPDGQILATGDMEGYLRVWELSTGRQRFTWPDVSLGVKQSICFSPDGRMLAYGDTDNVIKVVDVATGDIQASLSEHQAPLQLVRLSPDGSLLASSAEDGTILVWNMGTNEVANASQIRFRWSTSIQDLWNLAFSPDGRLLAAHHEENAVGVWNLKDGRLCYSFGEYLFGEGCLDFSRDGAFLITGSTDGNVRLWDATTGELRRTLEGHRGSVTSITVEPGGTHVASSSADGTIRLWDIQTGLCVKTMTPPGPYAGMDITGTTGLTTAQTAALRALGAVSD